MADLITALRVATMLVFMIVFVGILVWLLLPAGRRSAAAQARSILDDDGSGRDRA